MRVFLQPEAEADIEDGFWFYEEQESGVGDQFRSAVFNEIDSLLRFLDSGLSQEGRGFRKFRVKRFPWTIFYRLRKDDVLIQAVLDQRQEPERTREALDGRH